MSVSLSSKQYCCNMGTGFSQVYQTSALGTKYFTTSFKSNPDVYLMKGITDSVNVLDLLNTSS